MTTQRVLITGGTGGLGRALADEHLRRGARVLLGDLAPQAPDDLPAGAAYTQLDVTDDAQWAAARDLVQQEWGGLDVLYNNAGVATGGRIDRADATDWDRAIAINLMGVVRGAQTFTPMFKAQRAGLFVNTASLAGLVHGPGMGSYNVTKAGVVALSETMHFELAPFGIRTVVICPGFFRTGLADSMQGADREIQASGRKLIETSGRTPEQIVAEIMAGLERGEHRILTDDLGRTLVTQKREDPQAYEAGFADGARRLAHHELTTDAPG